MNKSTAAIAVFLGSIASGALFGAVNPLTHDLVVLSVQRGVFTGAFNGAVAVLLILIIQSRRKRKRDDR